jgi:hypothetical protein
MTLDELAAEVARHHDVLAADLYEVYRSARGADVPEWADLPEEKRNRFRAVANRVRILLAAEGCR